MEIYHHREHLLGYTGRRLHIVLPFSKIFLKKLFIASFVTQGKVIFELLTII